VEGPVVVRGGVAGVRPLRLFTACMSIYRGVALRAITINSWCGKVFDLCRVYKWVRWPVTKGNAVQKFAAVVIEGQRECSVRG